MAKGVTELVEDFKVLHPKAYARIYNQALEDLWTNVIYNYAGEISIKELQEEIELLKSKIK